MAAQAHLDADPTNQDADAATDPIASQLRDKLLKEGLKLDDGADDFASAVFEAMLGNVLSTAPQTKQPKRPRHDQDIETTNLTDSPVQQHKATATDIGKTTILKSADLIRAIAAAKPHEDAPASHRGHHSPSERRAPATAVSARTAQSPSLPQQARHNTATAAAGRSETDRQPAATSAASDRFARHKMTSRPAVSQSASVSTSQPVHVQPHVAVVAIEPSCVNQRATAIAKQVLDQLADILRGPSTSCSVIDIAATPFREPKRAKLASSAGTTVTTQESQAQLKADAAQIGQAMAIASQMPPTAATGSDFRLVSPGPTTFLASASAHAWAGALDSATVTDCASVIRSASEAPIIRTGLHTSTPTTVVVLLDTSARHGPAPPASIAGAAEARIARAATDRIVTGLPTIVYSMSRALPDSDAAWSAASQIASRLLTRRWTVSLASVAETSPSAIFSRPQLSKCDGLGSATRHQFFACVDSAQRSGHAIAIE